jgi:protein-S-isoprenylcysteine O-methyltransferase Ste14
MKADNPRVRVPPPLFYALALLVGFFLNRKWPLPAGDGALIILFASAICVAAVALSASSVRMFRRSRTSIVPVRPATALVVSGPYRFTRNPMYVGLAMLTFGLALFMNTWWPILLLVPVVLVVQKFVILREEAYLTRRFGDDYVAYMRRVRRWV